MMQVLCLNWRHGYVLKRVVFFDGVCDDVGNGHLPVHGRELYLDREVN
jgi:hypothetical protein